MKNTPIPVDDAERVAVVRSYELLDTPPELVYDEIAEILSQVCDCPIAVIGLMDETEDYYKSVAGSESDIHWAPREQKSAPTRCAAPMCLTFRISRRTNDSSTTRRSPAIRTIAFTAGCL